MALINEVPESNEIDDSDFINASSGGDEFVNGRNVHLVVKNESGSNRTVTINAVAECNHGFGPHHEAKTLADGSVWVTDFFPHGRFGSKPVVTYDDHTGVKIVAKRIGGYQG